MAKLDSSGDACECIAGYFGSDCSPCELGSFRDQASEFCQDCIDVMGPGSTTAGVGSASVTDCICEDAFFRDEEGSCKDCPAGASCQGRTVDLMELNPGYWRASPLTLNIIQCDEVRGKHICLGSMVHIEAQVEVGGSANLNAFECREGHHGNLCSECQEGYGKRLGLCEKCAKVEAEGIVYFVLGVGGVFMAVYLLVSQHLRRIEPRVGGKAVSKQYAAKLFAAPAGHGAILRAADGSVCAPMEGTGRTSQIDGAPPNTAPPSRQGPTGSAKLRDDESLTNSVVKVLITWLQLSSLAASVNVPMSPEMDTMVDWQNLGNVSPWSFSSVNCVFHIDYYTRFYFSCLMPLICVGIAVAVVGLRLVLGRKRLSGHQLDVGIMATQLLWLLTYTMVTEAVFGVFKCREIDSGLWVLSQDVSVKCGTKSHDRARLIGTVMIFLHTLGVPLQAAALMRWRRHEMDSLQMRVRFGFLYENYRADTFWYECFGMLRKASMVAAVVLLQDQTGLQVFTVSWVALTYLTVHSSAKPYDVDVLNHLETFALFVSAATLSSCSFFYVAKGRRSVFEEGQDAYDFEQAVSYLVIALSIALLAWCIALIFQDLTGIQFIKRAGSEGRTGTGATEKIKREVSEQVVADAEFANPLAGLALSKEVHQMVQGSGGVEVINPLATAAAEDVSGGPSEASVRLGTVTPQNAPPAVWFGDTWDAAHTGGLSGPGMRPGGTVEVANPVAAAQKSGAIDRGGTTLERMERVKSVVTPNPLLGGRLSNAQRLDGGLVDGGEASPWMRYLTYDGEYEYYHNTVTGEVSWERPAGYPEISET